MINMDDRYKIHKDNYDFYFDFIDKENRLTLDDIEMDKHHYFQELLKALNEYEEEKTKLAQQINEHIHTIKELKDEIKNKDKEIERMIYYNDLSHFKLSDNGIICTVKDGEEWLDTNTSTVQDYIDKMNQLVDANQGLRRQRTEQTWEINRLSRPKIIKVKDNEDEEFLMTEEEYLKFKEWQPSFAKENIKTVQEKPTPTLSHIDVYLKYKKKIKEHKGGLKRNGENKQ